MLGEMVRAAHASMQILLGKTYALVLRVDPRWQSLRAAAQQVHKSWSSQHGLGLARCHHLSDT